jgi:hypothetical protein
VRGAVRGELQRLTLLSAHFQYKVNALWNPFTNWSLTVSAFHVFATIFAISGGVISHSGRFGRTPSPSVGFTRVVLRFLLGIIQNDYGNVIRSTRGFGRIYQRPALPVPCLIGEHNIRDVEIGYHVMEAIRAQ